jgi:colanic acid biosynthesis glycosyl transferase WcaI
LKVLLLNQTFHPDVMATAQYLSDLAVALADRGHEVEVIASRRAYDEPERCFLKSETWRGVRIRRIATTAFGKKAKWRRAADFGSFIVSCCWRLLFTRRPDVVVALTSPPLISFIGALFTKWRRAGFVYWVMDLNPDEAIAAGWLREGSFAARTLNGFSNFSLRQARTVVALDRFMRDRIVAKGIAAEKVTVISPWSHNGEVRFDDAGRKRFRAAHGLVDKFVVMYSGNHSPCHPLDTLLAAAKALSGNPRVVFLFVGGGSELAKVKRVAAAEQQRNIFCLPYQPLNELSASLSAADLHAVVMGEPFVGVIHPCKIYNVLCVGAPVLCIGPKTSHLTEALDALGSQVCAAVGHGEVDKCAQEILRLADTKLRGEPDRYAGVTQRFARETLLPQLIAVLERT